jgi:hypothetical protein
LAKRSDSQVRRNCRNSIFLRCQLLQECKSIEAPSSLKKRLPRFEQVWTWTQMGNLACGDGAEREIQGIDIVTQHLSHRFATSRSDGTGRRGIALYLDKMYDDQDDATGSQTFTDLSLIRWVSHLEMRASHPCAHSNTRKWPLRPQGTESVS